jgi:hypothetical protein
MTALAVWQGPQQGYDPGLPKNCGSLAPQQSQIQFQNEAWQQGGEQQQTTPSSHSPGQGPGSTFGTAGGPSHSFGVQHLQNRGTFAMGDNMAGGTMRPNQLMQTTPPQISAWSVPPPALLPPVPGAGDDFLKQTIATLTQLLTVSQQREERMATELGALRVQVQDMWRELQNQRQESVAPRIDHNYNNSGHYNNSGNYNNSGRHRRSYPPYPILSPDEGPLVKEYLERSAELEEVLKKGESVADPDAQCEFIEHIGDLCEAEQVVKIHATGVDLVLGVGVAAAVVKCAGRPEHEPGNGEIGDIVKQEAGGHGTFYHLMTKEKSSHKIYKKPEPYLSGVKKAFRKLSETIKEEGLEEVAMSYMCSGSDKMHRLWIMDELYQNLKGVKVKVHFYNKYRSKRWMGAGSLFAPSDEQQEDEQQAEEQQTDLYSNPIPSTSSSESGSSSVNTQPPRKGQRVRQAPRSHFQ